MLVKRFVICKVSRQSVCMGDDVDGRHEMDVVIDCTGVDDVALYCADQIIKRNYIPSVVSGSTWIAEADGLPFAVVVCHADDTISVTRAECRIEIDDHISIFFSYHLRHDPERLLTEIQAGLRPRQ